MPPCYASMGYIVNRYLGHYTRRRRAANQAALGQFASPYFVLGRQRRSTYGKYASHRWLPRASSGSQLGPVPAHGPICFAILRAELDRSVALDQRRDSRKDDGDADAGSREHEPRPPVGAGRLEDVAKDGRADQDAAPGAGDGDSGQESRVASPPDLGHERQKESHPAEGAGAPRAALMMRQGRRRPPKRRSLMTPPMRRDTVPPAWAAASRPPAATTLM